MVPLSILSHLTKSHSEPNLIVILIKKLALCLGVLCIGRKGTALCTIEKYWQFQVCFDNKFENEVYNNP